MGLFLIAYLYVPLNLKWLTYSSSTVKISVTMITKITNFVLKNNNSTSFGGFCIFCIFGNLHLKL